jgi:uncharacterized protein YjiS (DUF1127 family)
MAFFSFYTHRASSRNAARTGAAPSANAVSGSALARSRIAQLRAMNAADLADIGLKPGDIGTIERQILGLG